MCEPKPPVPQHLLGGAGTRQSRQFRYLFHHLPLAPLNAQAVGVERLLCGEVEEPGAWLAAVTKETVHGEGGAGGTHCEVALEVPSVVASHHPMPPALLPVEVLVVEEDKALDVVCS